ncbi:hypothetical protein DPMN_181150, partial [Dreissena polymorpha]
MDILIRTPVLSRAAYVRNRFVTSYIDKRLNFSLFELLHVNIQLNMCTIVYLLWLSLIFHAGATGPLCHMCDDVVMSSHCPTVGTCLDTEQCVVQKLRAPSHREYFKLGCIPRN